MKQSRAYSAHRIAALSENNHRIIAIQGSNTRVFRVNAHEALKLCFHGQLKLSSIPERSVVQFPRCNCCRPLFVCQVALEEGKGFRFSKPALLVLYGQVIVLVASDPALDPAAAAAASPSPGRAPVLKMLDYHEVGGRDRGRDIA